MHTYWHDSNSNQQFSCSAFWRISPTCCARSRFSPQTASSAQKHQWQIAFFWFATQALLCPQIPCLSASLAILIIVFEKCMGLLPSILHVSVFLLFVSFSLLTVSLVAAVLIAGLKGIWHGMTASVHLWQLRQCKIVRQVNAPNKAIKRVMSALIALCANQNYSHVY